MEATTSSQLLLSLASLVSLLLLASYLAGHQDAAPRSAEVLEARLDQERDLLAAACAGLRQLEAVTLGGGAAFLGAEASLTLEQLAVAGARAGCGAAAATELVIGKIGRLETSRGYGGCVQHREPAACDQLVPALSDLENHFEIRLGLTEDLQAAVRQINDLIPSSKENSKKFNDASSVVTNLYLCLDFVISEVPSVYKLVLDPEAEAGGGEVSSLQTAVSVLVQTSCRVLLLAAVWLLAPRTVWRLHLFVMKVLILFSVTVLCLATYNYCASVVLSLRLARLRGHTEDPRLAVTRLRVTEHVWSLDTFQAAQLQRGGGAGAGHSRGDTARVDLELGDPTHPDTDRFFEHTKVKLRELEEAGGREHGDLVAEVGVVVARCGPQLRAVRAAVAVFAGLNQHTRETLGQVHSGARGAGAVLAGIPQLREVEEDLASLRLKLLGHVRKLHKVRAGVARAEAAAGRTVGRAATLGALLGAVSSPLLHPAPGPGSSTAPRPRPGSVSAPALSVGAGLAAAVSAHAVSWSRSSWLAAVAAAAAEVAAALLELLSALDTVDAVKLRSALEAAGEAMAGSGGEQEISEYLSEAWAMLDSRNQSTIASQLFKIQD